MFPVSASAAACQSVLNSAALDLTNPEPTAVTQLGLLNSLAKSSAAVDETIVFGPYTSPAFSSYSSAEFTYSLPEDSNWNSFRFAVYTPTGARIAQSNLVSFIPSRANKATSGSQQISTANIVFDHAIAPNSQYYLAAFIANNTVVYYDQKANNQVVEQDSPATAFQGLPAMINTQMPSSPFAIKLEFRLCGLGQPYTHTHRRETAQRAQQYRSHHSFLSHCLVLLLQQSTNPQPPTEGSDKLVQISWTGLDCGGFVFIC